MVKFQLMFFKINFCFNLQRQQKNIKQIQKAINTSSDNKIKNSITIGKNVDKLICILSCIQNKYIS